MVAFYLPTPNQWCSPSECCSNGLPFFRLLSFGQALLTLLGHALQLGYDVCALAGPLLLRRLLLERNTYLVVILSSLSVLESLLSQSVNQMCNINAFSLATLLRTGILEKSLKLNSHAQLRFPSGSIINLSSFDVDQIERWMAGIHEVWNPMLQIAVTISIVTWLMGNACLWGILMPIAETAFSYADII